MLVKLPINTDILWILKYINIGWITKKIGDCGLVKCSLSPSLLLFSCCTTVPNFLTTHCLIHLPSTFFLALSQNTYSSVILLTLKINLQETPLLGAGFTLAATHTCIFDMYVKDEFSKVITLLQPFHRLFSEVSVNILSNDNVQYFILWGLS